jgi:thioredoxin reductase (NADPH)
MPEPVILAIEDDPAALADVERELHDRYARSYRIVSTRSPAEALQALTQLAEAKEEVALVLAGQWLSTTTGSELLERVGQLHPHAKRGLLVPWRAWAHRPTAEAIFDAMSLGRINYYLLRPAGASDELFHHAVSGFLLEWAKDRMIAPHTIHVVGESWKGRAYELRDILHRCAIPHAFSLADSSKGRELLTKAGREATLPLIALPDGTILSDPTDLEIAEATGTSIDPEHDEFDVAVVGAGPAGLSAAVYGASEGLRTVVIDQGGIGGQATSSALIRNYLGFPRGLSGRTLAEQAYEQAWVFRARFAFMQAVTGLDREGDLLVLSLADNRRVAARAVVLATGATYRRLDVPALEPLNGAGVFYGGSAAEAPAMTGKDAYIVGGANSAGQAALHLARYARRVTLVIRAQSLGSGMSHYLAQEVKATPNIEVRTDTTVVGGGGEGHLEHLVLRGGATGREETVAADGLFILIGARPNTDWLPDEIARDSKGFVFTGEDIPSDSEWPLERPPLSLETSMPGVFAAGDVRLGSVKRVASAVGEGSVAIQLVHDLVERHPHASQRADRESTPA